MSILSSKTSDGATLPEVGFPKGWSQTFVRWIIKPHYHILCWLPPPPISWLTHLKCTGRGVTPVTYLHFKCPRLKRIWRTRSFQHIPLSRHSPFKVVRNHTLKYWRPPTNSSNSSLDPCGILTEISFHHDIWYFHSFCPEQILKYQTAQFKKHAYKLSEMSGCRLQADGFPCAQSSV